MKYSWIFAIVLMSTSHAVAQHSHGSQKGPNGGPVQDVAGVHAELLTSGTTVTVNILDEANKPVSTKGFSGTALLVAGGDRETVQLAPSGDSSLTGNAKKPIGPGTTVTVVIKTATGKSGQAKY